MKILLVTGRLAEQRVREVAEKFNCVVVVAQVDIASCLTPKQIADISCGGNFDLLLVPGLIKGNLEIVEKKTGIKTFKGPKDAADLEYVLENIKSVKLSKEIPAEELIQENLKAKALDELRVVNSSEYIREMLKKPGNMLIGSLPVGRDFPTRVLAEIVDAGNLSKKELLRRARYLKNSGADIIDLGFNEKNPAGVRAALRLLKKKINLPVSADTMEEENIKAALKSRADMILSFDSELLQEFGNVTTPSVVIPERRDMPINPAERIKVLEENIELARYRGFKNIIADLILQPVNFGFTDSIVAYKEFSEKHSYPVLMGAGNVTELFDADSVGMNALLAAVAAECGAGIIFTAEASDKTRGSVRELATASKMMHLSRLRSSPPKDLGIDLLFLKEKRMRRERLQEKVKKVKAKTAKEHPLDEKGYFKIFVGDDIKCVHYSDGTAEVCIEGSNAREICDALYAMRLISNYAHALYLGRELQKAELALKFGRSYVQS